MRKTDTISLSSIVILLLLMVFLFTPFAMFRRVIIIYPLFFLWLIITLKTKWISGAKGLIGCLIAITFLHILLSEQTDYNFNHFISFNLPTALWTFCFVYYSRKSSQFRRIIPLLLLVFIVSCILTIRANLILPGASRFLATSADSSWSDIRSRALSLFCGGYEFIFAIPFLLFPLMLQWKYKCIQNRLLLYLTVASILVCVVVGSFFTAIILTVASIFLTRVPTDRLGKAFFAILFFVGLLLLLKDVLLQGLINIGEMIDSPMLTKRAEQALYGTYVSDYQESDSEDRFERLANAFYNISQSPFWGRLSGINFISRPSGHSEFLGYFEDFGIFGFVYVIFYWTIFKTIRRCFKTNVITRYFDVFYILFIVFLIVDKFDVATGTAAIVFFVSPLLMLIIDEHLSNNNQIVVCK